MKVRLVVTVEVDPKVWAAEYGPTRRDVREDVKDYFTNHLYMAPAVLYTGLELTVR